MGVGTSIVVIAIGAVLDFAVTVQTNGFNLNRIGLILMLVGAVGLVLSLVFWSSWGGFGGSRRVTRVQSDPYGTAGYGQVPAGTQVVQEERRI
jgi:hypothetical protein